MTEIKDLSDRPALAEPQPQQTADHEGAVVRLVVSLIVLALFFGALAYEYWPDMVPAALRVVNSARSVGAKPVGSQIFEVRNNSDASEAQVRLMVTMLEKQYQAIADYLKVTPGQKLQVLVVNGQGTALMDGAQLVVNYDNGMMDTDLAPLFLVMMIEQNQLDPQNGIVPAAGHALQVVEAAGLGEFLIRQPLDDWVALLRQNKAYMPLDHAWLVGLPNDENSAYDLMRALLETGSFMRWLTEKEGLEASQRLARGDTFESVTGKSMAENEDLWLKSLDEQKIEPKTCDLVVPRGSFFSLVCGKIDEASH